MKKHISNFFRKFFKIKEKKKENRIYPSDIIKGDIITITDNNIQTGIGNVLVMNNDIEDRKVLVEYKWNTKVPNKFNKELRIINYDDYAFSSFNLLNHELFNLRKPKKSKKPSIESLKKELDSAISLEDYEKARIIQDKINKLTK